MVAFGELKTYASELLDPETRVPLLAKGLDYIGAEKVLAPVGVSAETVANLATVAALKVKKEELATLAKPYIAKAYDKDGRKELVAEANEKIIKPAAEYALEVADPYVAPLKEKLTAGKELAEAKYMQGKEIAEAKYMQGKEIATPYILSARDQAAPYIAKLDSKTQELVGAKRYEAAMAALAKVREHPTEVATELRATAVDLIRYENVKAYQEFVLSEQFQADTISLVKVQLPALASEYAKRGSEALKVKAQELTVELEAQREKAAAAFAKGYTMAKNGEAEDAILALSSSLKAMASQLLTEVSVELKAGVAHAKSEGLSYDDLLNRLKRVASVLDTIVVTPIRTKMVISLVEPASEPAAEDECCAKEGVAPETTGKACNGATNGASNGAAANGNGVATNATAKTSDGCMNGLKAEGMPASVASSDADEEMHDAEEEVAPEEDDTAPSGMH